MKFFCFFFVNFLIFFRVDAKIESNFFPMTKLNENDEFFYEFEKSFDRDLRISNENSENLLNLISEAKFAVLMKVKQSAGNSGHLLSIEVGDEEFFELQSDSVRGFIRIYYKSSNSTSRTIQIPDANLAPGGEFRKSQNSEVNLAPGGRLNQFENPEANLAPGGEFHQLIVELDGDRLRLILNCRELFNNQISPIEFLVANRSQTKIWLGQKNRYHSYFEGEMKEFRIEPVPVPIQKFCPTLKKISSEEKIL